jgi:FkbH-like protein
MKMKTDFNGLIKNLKSSFQCQKTINVAVLADSAAQHLNLALKAVAVEYQIKLNIWEADYDAIASVIYDKSSCLYSQDFSYILIFQSSQKLYTEFINGQKKECFAKEKAFSLSVLISLLEEHTKAKIIVTNFTEQDDSVFGNFANKTVHSFLYQVRNLNIELMNLAIQRKNLFIVDVQNLLVWEGRKNAFNAPLNIHADLIFELDFMVLLARSTMKVLMAIEGIFKKCVILDLDNILWGGVVGDDGLNNIQIGDLGLGKAFANLQIWLRQLKERGIVLAVCSKNDEATAREVFEQHPQMILRLEDIAVFVANWESKADNILFIQSVLNIAFDSMVFLDDNPFERAIVKQTIPEITVPDLPDDPAEYLPFLQSLNLFEIASFSHGEENRTRQYQDEAVRLNYKKNFTTYDAFLKGLKMTAEINPLNSYNIPRVAQLTLRSNQYNLRTIRYTEQDIERIMKNPKMITLAATLEDIFGNYGLISAIILEKRKDNTLFIDTWIMSCRVLKRGIEYFLLNEIIEIARAGKIKFIHGEYIPTAKNAIVKDHFSALGFVYDKQQNVWSLSVDEYIEKNTFITKLITYVNPW